MARLDFLDYIEFKDQNDSTYELERGICNVRRKFVLKELAENEYNEALKNSINALEVTKEHLDRQKENLEEMKKAFDNVSKKIEKYDKAKEEWNKAVDELVEWLNNHKE